MRKIVLISTILIVLFLLNSLSFAQSITIKWQDGNGPMAHDGTELAVGSSIMIISALGGTHSLVDPTLSSQYFLTADDSLTALKGNFTGFNPLPFNPSVPGKEYPGIPLDAPDYQEGADNLIYVYLRVFDNISYDDFDSSGNWNGEYMNMSNPMTHYFETDVFAISIPENPLQDTPVVIDISGMQANMGPLPGGAPVPEPSAMFLMAAGMCWFVSRFKRK